MAPEDTSADPSAQAELAENEAVKEDEVLEREGLEQELMQQDDSELGEVIEGVQEPVDE